MRQKLLLVAAVFFGILAFVLSYQQINAEKEKIRGSTVQLDVVALKKGINAEEEITDEHIVSKRVTHFKNDTTNADIPWNKRHSIIGSKVVSSHEKGDILTWPAIDISAEESGRTGLTAKIDTGKVAFAIPVDTVMSLNGLIRPNNRVDVLLTEANPNGGADKMAFVTKTMMRDVRVLACGANMGYQETGRVSRSYGTITLEVTPVDARALALAQRVGRLSLVLRSPDGYRISDDGGRDMGYEDLKDYINRQYKKFTDKYGDATN